MNLALRREVLLTIGVLTLVNLILAFGSVGLFVRMGPAIEHIIEENVSSIVAAEEIAVELAEAGNRPVSAEARTRIDGALVQAQRNLTEDGEPPVLAALEQHLPAAMEGDAGARGRAVTAAHDLIRINREAMLEADADAKRLGTAGAWTAVFLGFLSFLLSVFVVVRLQKRFVGPLMELHDVLEDSREGDRLRRCRLADAPREVVQVSEAVNRLLDERLEKRERTI